MEALRLVRSNLSVASTRLVLSELDLIKQIKNVLRLGVGNHFILMDGLGGRYEMEIEQFTKNQINCLIVAFHQEDQRALPMVEICLALIKADRFEWCLEKLTELGADQITPVLTQHCIMKIEKAKEKLQRWQTIVRESTEQCERSAITRIVTPVSFSDCIYCINGGGTELGQDKHLKLICAERTEAATLLQVLCKKDISNRDLVDIKMFSRISILVGPEGGFADSELAAAKSEGWQAVSLGSRILRAETAAISAMAQIASVLDMQ